jgi:uncharacterized protein YndB with AHSA1/START domain
VRSTGSCDSQPAQMCGKSPATWAFAGLSAKWITGLGGGFRFVIEGPDGRRMGMRGVYEELVPPERSALINDYESVGWGFYGVDVFSSDGQLLAIEFTPEHGVAWAQEQIRFARNGDGEIGTHLPIACQQAFGPRAARERGRKSCRLATPATTGAGAVGICGSVAFTR